MRYSLWHRTTLIGHTDLSYDTCMTKSRMGQFLPSAAGLALLAVNGHLDRVDLELRDEAGRVIPTEFISISDYNRLGRFGGEAGDIEYDDEDLDDETRAAIEHDVALIDEWLAEGEPDGLWKDYEGEEPWDESKPFYQIFVQLHDPSAIPSNSEFLVQDSP